MNRSTTLRLLVGTILSGAALTGAMTMNVAVAAESGVHKSVSFDIPAQGLSTALLRFSEQARVQVTAPSGLVGDLKTDGIRGTYGIDQALQQMLRGSGLSFQFINEHSVSIHGDSTSQLETIDEVIVAGRLIDEVSMMKRGETLRETPQSVTIMTQQRIQEQSLNSVSELISQAPGMTVEADAFGKPATYYSRGFEVSNMQVDGASMDVNRSYYFSPNLAMYEQVEILRGADGLFAGAGDPGGTINLVRKRGLNRQQTLLNLSAGSWNNFIAEVDVTGPLAFDGRLRGRAVAHVTDREFFYDIAQEDSQFYYATVEGDLTDSTVLIAGGSIEKRDEMPNTAGAMRYANGQLIDLPRTAALIADWATWTSDTEEVFLRLEQRLGASWKLAASATHGESEKHLDYAVLRTNIEAPGSTSALYFYSPYSGYEAQRNVFDVSLTGPFELFGRRHTVLMGFDSQRTDNSSRLVRYPGATSSPVDMFDFGAGSIPLHPQSVRSGDYQVITRQHGFYAKLQLELADRVKLAVGGRYSSYENESPSKFYNDDGSISGTSLLSYKDSGVFIPYGSLLYTLNDHWTVYGSVTEIYTSQAQYLSGPLPGRPLDPVTGRNYEIGTKSELRDGKLTLAFALYRTERSGQAEGDPLYTQQTIGDEGHACCYLELGDVESQGFETEVSGEVLPGLSLFSGYTFNENDNKRSGTRLNTLTPKHVFKVWSSYRLPLAEQRWLVGAGVTVRSEGATTYTGLVNGVWTPARIEQGGYSVWSAMAQYSVNDIWSVALNGNNLFDKKYFGNLQYRSLYGDPANVMLTVRAKF
ncbi:TonB-dependent siderophore receptor [Steroidobacter sp.]|uniref:TonB-dependent siderophore receptor n=1 Tax=Steroidobacter sp. TaxID=1978227 RepID=UPI001A56390B|nr:TonB-dependent receptor [Steroidobacter sp.]MBL8271467.1 TonB-dependent siderophore receptor [Steroidobacter sp.]